MAGNTENGAQLARRESDLVSYSGPDRVISSREFWEEEDKKPVIERSYKSGIPSLDQATEGFETGEVWVVSGPPKHGKTLLCDTIGRNFIQNGTNCLWFSFEVTPKKFLAKYKAPGSPIVYIPRERTANNLEWLETKVHEAKLKYECRAVFIDHLHFIADLNQLMKNSSIYIGGVMRFLKQEIALKHNVCVFLVAHLGKITFNNEPEESDIRDSSFVSQEADGTIMVYRRLEKGKKATDENAFTNKARIKICNARRSGAMQKRIDMLKLGEDFVEEEQEGDVVSQDPPPKKSGKKAKAAPAPELPMTGEDDF